MSATKPMGVFQQPANVFSNVANHGRLYAVLCICWFGRLIIVFLGFLLVMILIVLSDLNRVPEKR